MKIWIFFCAGMEIGICGVAQYCDCNIVRVEIIKFIIYVSCYISLNILMKKRKCVKDVIFRLNCLGSITLSSLMNAVTMTLLLQSESKIGGLGLLLAYIITIVLLCFAWKKSRISDGEANEGNKGKVVSGIAILAALGFARIASDNEMKIILIVLLIILIWGYLFGSFLFFVRCKNDLKDIFKQK